MCDWFRAAIIQYLFEQRTFRQSAQCLGSPGRMIASIDMEHQQEFNFVLPASESVSHSLYLCLTEFVPPWLVLMIIAHLS